MAPAEGRADRHAAALGGGGHRVALAQRPAEVEPAFLLAQPGQRRAGQRVETLAARLAAEPPQSISSTAGDRFLLATVRAAPLIILARLDDRRHRRARRASRQDRFEFDAPRRAQVVNLRKLGPKDAVLHDHLHHDATDSSRGNDAYLARIEPILYLNHITFGP